MKALKNSVLTTLLAIFTGTLLLCENAMAEALPDAEYKAAEKKIDTDYDAAKVHCKSFSANHNDICMAEAKGQRSVAKADLKFKNAPTVKNRYDTRVARADANYAVASEKCDDRAGNDKDVCVKEAKAAKVHEMTAAEAARKTANADADAAEATIDANTKALDANTKALEKARDAHNDAAIEQRDANYAVEKEKCDALAGKAKDSCRNDVKARYGKM